MNRRIFLVECAAIVLLLSWLNVPLVRAEPLGGDSVAIHKIADPILDNILKAMAAGDHAAYIRDFDEVMRKVSGEAEFKQAVKLTKAALGTYKSREPLGFMTVKNVTVVLWKARFSDFEDDVLIRLSLAKVGDQVQVSGLFFQ